MDDVEKKYGSDKPSNVISYFFLLVQILKYFPKVVFTLWSL